MPAALQCGQRRGRTEWHKEKILIRSSLCPSARPVRRGLGPKYLLLSKGAATPRPR